MAAQFGFHASHEQRSPRELLDHVKKAERAGFKLGMCSDHFHPWSERQGESGFAWSWLGAALEATQMSFGVVCAPGQRYHPAIIAQASATLAQLYPGRFWLAVGSGEALNESITGEPWPSKLARNERLREAAEVIRALWAGESVNHDGYFKVRNAKLYTRPETAPLLVGAALTPETAARVAKWVDGLITAGSSRDGLRQVVEAFRENGGEHKPLYLQAAFCLSESKEDALSICHDQWRQAALEMKQISDLPTPVAFDRATSGITQKELKTKVRIAATFEELWEDLLLDSELGFSHIYLHQIGPDLERLFDGFQSRPDKK